MNRLNSLDSATIRALTNSEVYDLLRNELDLVIGPVTSTTRKLYEKILEDCIGNVDALYLIQAKYRKNLTPARQELNESVNNKENQNEEIEEDLEQSEPIVTRSTRTQTAQLGNYSFTEDEANAEIGRQIRFGMSSTPITEPKHTRYQETKSVSFDYLVEEVQEDEGNQSFEDINAQKDYRPLANEKMHTVRATLGPRPRVARPIIRNFSAEHQAHQKEVATESHFFRNVCILAIFVAFSGLYIGYKLQNL